VITQLGLVTVIVSNLARAQRFYRDKLGLRMIFYNRPHKWLTFDCGRGTLSLTVPWNRRSKKLVGARTGISFFVDDIEATYKVMKKRAVKFHVAPRTEPWGGKLANFEDPDRNQFFLVQMPADWR
jgi:catechol 2,3-dioxygenase-like lactoylglutathione lyase family enzyme